MNIELLQQPPTKRDSRNGVGQKKASFETYPESLAKLTTTLIIQPKPKRSVSDQTKPRVSRANRRRGNGPKRAVTAGTVFNMMNPAAAAPYRRVKSLYSKGMNIFCGEEIISTDVIMEEIEELKNDDGIVTLELEDLLGRSSDSEQIAAALRDALRDPRPWEGVVFTDDILVSDLKSLKYFQQRRKVFLWTLGDIFEDMLIPVKFVVKVTVPETADIQSMEAVLKQMKSDKSVTTLNISSSPEDSPRMLEQAVDLFQCDKREWEDFNLNVAGRVLGIC